MIDAPRGPLRANEEPDEIEESERPVAPAVTPRKGALSGTIITTRPLGIVTLRARRLGPTESVDTAAALRGDREQFLNADQDSSFSLTRLEAGRWGLGVLDANEELLAPVATCEVEPGEIAVVDIEVSDFDTTSAIEVIVRDPRGEPRSDPGSFGLFPPHIGTLVHHRDPEGRHWIRVDPRLRKKKGRELILKIDHPREGLLHLPFRPKQKRIVYNESERACLRVEYPNLAPESWPIIATQIRFPRTEVSAFRQNPQATQDGSKLALEGWRQPGPVVIEFWLKAQLFGADCAFLDAIEVTLRPGENRVSHVFRDCLPLTLTVPEAPERALLRLIRAPDAGHPHRAIYTLNLDGESRGAFPLLPRGTYRAELQLPGKWGHHSFRHRLGSFDHQAVTQRTLPLPASAR